MKIPRLLKSTAARLRMAELALRWRNRGPSAPHSGLERRLIVSLTSFPPRFAQLSHTLRSILLQDMSPDGVELCVTEIDRGKLPASVLELRDHGLSLRIADDLKPYKKIIPLREADPDAIIVTADDDVYYHPGWLRELVSAYDPARQEVLCHRGHLMKLGTDGLPAPYAEWQLNTGHNEASPLIFPTGAGGVLYPPGVHAPDLLRRDLFLKYCPTNDDIWLYWMGLLQGTRFRKIGPARPLVTWPGSQAAGLWNQNRYGNDRQIAQMIAAYGFPVTKP